MEKLEEITLYRFRVRTHDGREAVSKIVATRKALHARLAGEPLSEAPEPMLANPRWSSKLFAHGDQATMLIDAPGLDGRTLRFLVEQKSADGTWAEYAQAEAKVDDGVAQARLPLHHPKPGERDAAPADLRFACELA